ncbi:MAG: PAS domain S-box protein [Anaerolineae bacterium]|nr:PAS domain S-box protein [Anaerolineae bacterium]
MDSIALAERFGLPANLIDLLSDAIIGVDTSLVIGVWNPAAERLYGWGAAEVIGKRLPDVLQTRFLDDTFDQSFTFLNQTGSWNGLVIQLHREGHRLRIESNVSLVRSASGDTIGMMAVNRPVSEARTRSNRSVGLDERYRTYFVSNPQPMWITDMETLAFLDVNNAAIQHYGYSRDEFLSMTEVDIRPADELPRQLEAISAYASAYSLPEVWRHRRKDGSLIDVEVSAQDIDYGGRRARLILAYDVTARVQIDQVFLQKRQLLFNLIDHLPQFVYIKDGEGRFLICNHEAALIRGCQSPRDVIGKTDSDFFTPEIARLYSDKDESVLATGQPILKEEEWMVDAAGRRMWVMTSRFPLLDRDGSIIGVIATGLNIDDRKRAEEALKHSEVRYRALWAASQRQAQELSLLAHVRTLVARELELQPLVRQIVSAVAETFGYPRVSLYLMDENVLKLQHQTGQEHPALEIPVSKGIAGLAVRTGRAILAEDARAHPDYLDMFGPIVSQISLPLIDRQTVIGVIDVQTLAGSVLTKDDLRIMQELAEHITLAITRAQFYANLRGSEERYRMISDMISDYAYYHQVMPDGSVQRVWVTDSIERVLGYHPSEIRAGDISAVMDPEDLPRRDSDVARVLAGESVTGEYRLRRKSGEVRWIRLTRKPILDPVTRRVTAYVGVAQDVTDLRQAEKQRMELDLERERIALLREFIGNMSHDLKTPLTVINSSVYLLEKYTDPDRQQEKIEVIKEQVALLGRLIQDTLTLSRLDHSSQLSTETLESVEVNQLVSEAVHNLRPEADRKSQTLTVILEPGLPPLLTNHDELYRVVGNLLENAIFYTPDHGSITLSTRLADHKLVFTITDTGMGIAPADLDRIFGRFFRSDRSRSAKIPGTGLGLAIVKRVVDMHKGRIEVESTLGTGTTFRVYLPAGLPLTD